jgi:hypothetical protein
MTPVLTECHGIDPAGILRHFKEVSADLPAGLAELVEEKIRELQEKKGMSSEHPAGG